MMRPLRAKIRWASIAQFDDVASACPSDGEQSAPIRIERLLEQAGSSTVSGLEDGPSAGKRHGPIGGAVPRLMIAEPRHRRFLNNVDPGSLRRSSATADESDPELVR